MGANDAFELLLAIERRSQASARGLPEQVEVKTTQAGVGFRIGDARLVAPLGVIREILTYPPLAHIPGAKPWLKGVANVRGNLLPVTDLGGFLTGRPTPAHRAARVLVVTSGGIGAGLLVDEVLGLRHFFEEDHVPDNSAIADFVRRFVSGVYRQEGTVWGSIDLHALIESDEFMRVAA